MKRYYSSRKNPKNLTVISMYNKLQHVYLYFRDKDYFKKKAGITQHELPESIKHQAAIVLSFQPFPITKWSAEDVTEEHIFEVIEFLYDHVSEPGNWVEMVSDSGFNYHDYDGYNDTSGQCEFRKQVNAFLCDYKSGFELCENGEISFAGTRGLQYLLDAEIVAYDEKNVDGKVRNAILKWRNRHLKIAERREAIRDLADVFEWLKKTKKLEKVLNHKDEAALFEIANNFAIRHHDPRQKREYDPNIWYPWMFHFFLATYHAVIRLLVKEEQGGKNKTGLGK